MYDLTLKDGEQCKAKLIKINQQYNRHCEEPLVFRRVVDVPGKKQHIQLDDVVEWRMTND